MAYSGSCPGERKRQMANDRIQPKYRAINFSARPSRPSCPGSQGGIASLFSTVTARPAAGSGLRSSSRADESIRGVLHHTRPAWPTASEAFSAGGGGGGGVVPGCQCHPSTNEHATNGNPDGYKWALPWEAGRRYRQTSCSQATSIRHVSKSLSTATLNPAPQDG